MIDLVIEWASTNVREDEKFSFVQFAMEVLRDYPEANLNDIYHNQFLNGCI